MELAFLMTVLLLLAALGLREVNRNGVIISERAKCERIENSRRLLIDALERESQRCIRAEAMVAELQTRIRDAVTAHAVMRDAIGC